MRVSVIGCGHLGAPHAAAMAELGHEVLGVELNAESVKMLQAGHSPFYEVGLEDLLDQHVPTGRLRFTTNLAEAAEWADLHFIAVGTPLSRDGRGYDVGQVLAAVRSLAPLLTRPATIVGKSTVTAGTVARLQDIISEHAGHPDVELVWNPEFLREGHAVEDSLYPDRIVAGLTSPAAEAAIREVYAPLIAREGVELIVCDPASAEVLKGAANAFLAMKISFINAMAEVCEAVGADVSVVAHGIGIDPRIGHRGMRPGVGYGGGCLPKDVRAFTHRARQVGADHAGALLDAVECINDSRRDAARNLVERAHGNPLGTARVAVLGASFKAGTSDVRDSPALRLAGLLHDEAAHTVIYDPEAIPAARRLHPEYTYADDLKSALHDADVVVVATEWPHFRDPALPDLAAELVGRRVVVDVRTCIDPGTWTRAGFTVHQLGRPAHRPAT